MAIITNIVIDNVNSTAILIVTSAGNSVETITYSNVTKIVTFNSRPDINITASEFLDYISQINIFQTAILFNFSPNVFLTIPFGSTNCTENHDTILNKWNLVCIYGNTPRVCNYSYDIPSLTMTFYNRASSKTIEFLEWVYFLSQLNHYRNSVKGI